MYARNKVVLNHAHSGWIDVETVLKAANNEWQSPEEFAEQRGNEGFLIMCVLESELSGYLMRWDDAYDWIYRYASPVRARDVLERALNIEKAYAQDVGFDYPLYDFLTEEEKEFQLALEENFGDDQDENANEDEDEDIAEILSSLQGTTDENELIEEDEEADSNSLAHRLH